LEAAGLILIAAYAVSSGTSSFLEAPLAGRRSALRLDAAVRLGALFLALLALLLGPGATYPGLRPMLSGLGIGILAGIGSVCYILALERWPVGPAASVADAYVVVTVVLGVVVLDEPLTWRIAVGLSLAVGGMLVLAFGQPVNKSAGHRIRQGGVAAERLHRLARPRRLPREAGSWPPERAPAQRADRL
jgi:drug/metabolite transporter (DMT)-like permease